MCPVSLRGGFPDPSGFPLCFLFSGLHSGQLWLSASTACLPVCGQRSALGPRFSEGSEKSRAVHFPRARLSREVWMEPWCVYGPGTRDWEREVRISDGSAALFLLLSKGLSVHPHRRRLDPLRARVLALLERGLKGPVDHICTW